MAVVGQQAGVVGVPLQPLQPSPQPLQLVTDRPPHKTELEVVAYRFRAITITLSNRSAEPITRVKLTYTGGSIETAELKPGGSVTRVPLGKWRAIRLRASSTRAATVLRSWR